MYLSVWLLTTIPAPSKRSRLHSAAARIIIVASDLQTCQLTRRRATAITTTEQTTPAASNSLAANAQNSAEQFQSSFAQDRSSTEPSFLATPRVPISSIVAADNQRIATSSKTLPLPATSRDSQPVSKSTLSPPHRAPVRQIRKAHQQQQQTLPPLRPFPSFRLAVGHIGVSSQPQPTPPARITFHRPLPPLGDRPESAVTNGIVSPTSAAPTASSAMSFRVDPSTTSSLQQNQQAINGNGASATARNPSSTKPVALPDLPNKSNNNKPILGSNTISGPIKSGSFSDTTASAVPGLSAMPQQQDLLPTRVVFVRIATDSASTATNTSQSSSTDRIQLFPETTNDELHAMLVSISGFPEDALDEIDVWMVLTDGRRVAPSVSTLLANNANNPYTIHVVRSLSTEQENASVAHEISVSDIAQELQSIGDISARANEVQLLKDSMTNLRRRLERIDVDKLTFGKSFGMLSKAPKRVVSESDRYGESLRYEFTDQTREWLRSPTFDNWQWDDNEMLALFELIFDELGLIKTFNMNRITLRRFLNVVRETYKNNPFHNFKHAFCVTQMMYGIIHVTGLVDRIKPEEKLSLVVACIGHDLDHPGYNNAYQINAKTELAIVYNDNAPLEMHHSATLFNILRRNESNIFEGLTEQVFRDVRKLIVRCILSTDMARHGEILAQFKKAAEAFNIDDPEHRALLLSMVVKCSDISNEVRPADVAEPWVNCLLEEFFAQSDREKAEGLPTAPFMDREKVTKPSAQVGFIGYVMIPLYETLGKVLPNMDVHIVEPIKQSLNFYKDLLEKENGAPKK